MDRQSTPAFGKEHAGVTSSSSWAPAAHCSARSRHVSPHGRRAVLLEHVHALAEAVDVADAAGIGGPVGALEGFDVTGAGAGHHALPQGPSSNRNRPRSLNGCVASPAAS
jgi:hypothetical protein